MPLTFFWLFLIFTFAGVPVVFGLAAAPYLGILLAEREAFLPVIPQRIFFGINQFPLLAIPLFILAGELMNAGQITQRIVRFANSMVGHFRGGLGHVTIVSAMLFSGLSGSAVADASALGALLIPGMEKQGYSKRYAAALLASATVLGPIIPPSIIMVIYAYVMQVSVAGLFLAGMGPGIVVTIGLMVVHYLISRKRGYPMNERMASLREFGQAGKGAVLPLLTPVIILGGMLGGVFTPTEAAGTAVFYALILGLLVLGTLRVRDLPEICLRTGVISAAILLVVGTATVFGWIASLSGVPNLLASTLFGYTQDPYTLLFIINVLLLVTGMFLDAGPAILILGPILGPTMVQLGVDPLHFAIIMCVNLSIGLATPPMGLLLFVCSSMTRLSIEAIVREMLPYYTVHVGVIFLVTYVPALAMWLPKAFGF